MIRPIGAGGMASVWWARHELIGRDVALKLSPASRDPLVVGRFLREAHIIGKFRHRNIVGVLDAGELPDDGLLFLAMELLQGAPLSAHFVHGRPLHPGYILPLLIDVCRGLEVAHAEGVVHRDIKPENIFLADAPGEGVVAKILDFGISRLEGASDALTVDGELLGTPSYMSPEQAAGRTPIDARADLWAIGVILYEALTGTQPFKADQPYAVLRRILDATPAPLPPNVDPHLRAIVHRCLEKDPARRHPDAAALRTDLEEALARCARGDAAAAVEVPAATPDAVAPPAWRVALCRLVELRRSALRRIGRLGPSNPLHALLRAPRPAAPGRTSRPTSMTLGLAVATALAAALASGATQPRRPADAAAEPLRAVPLAARFGDAARATAAELARACAPPPTPDASAPVPAPARAAAPTSTRPPRAGAASGGAPRAARGDNPSPAPAPPRPRGRWITSPGF